MTKLYKFFAIGFVCVYFSISILLVAMIDIKGTVSPENRNLATFPSLSDYKKIPIGFEEWLNDRVGFRSILTSEYLEFIFKLFGEVKNPYVLFGSNGYSFLATYPKDSPRYSTLDGVLGTSYRDNNTLATYVKELQQMFLLIDKLHIQYISLWIPSSPYFKYNNLPYHARIKVPIDFITDPVAYKIIDKMDSSQRNKLMFPLEELKQLNQFTDVYPSRNFHWQENSPATFLVASLIAERFKKSHAAMPDLNNYTLKCSKYSDISSLVGFKIENKPFYCLSNSPGDNATMKSVNRKFDFANTPIKILINPTAQGKIFLFGNSFTPAIIDDISQYFNETIFLHLELSENLYGIPWEVFVRGLFKEWQPEYVVFVIHVGFKAYGIDSLFSTILDDRKQHY